ncbi:MAG: glycosyltransferase family 4 protein [Chloroflexi bacterium]|nr:glycosyltransferase family 4 protein [Chloroflexota bacterium]MDA8189071.1 glycosyltransferase family 1 protein [Dehalococcoidales bacterium]
MRIGIDYTAAVNQGAGIGRYVRGLVGSLASLDHSNEYVLFYSYRQQKKPKLVLAERPNFRERALPVSDKFLAILWHRLGIPLPVDLLTGQVDVFHSPDFVLPPVRRASKVLTVHDLSYLLFPECADEGLRSYLERAVPSSIARADIITADSINTRKDLICLLDAPPERVEVVYGGVEERFKPLNGNGDALPATRRKYGLNYPFVLSVGVIEPRKNLARLLQAYALLRLRPDFEHKLVIAGAKGWLCDDLFRMVQELRLSKDVVFLGHVSDADLVALYNLADVFAYPSLYEGFGFPVLEAMACGTPVVSSNSSSLPEVVGDAGLMVPPEDVEAIAGAIERMLSDSQLARDSRAKGLERAKGFTWHRAAERIMAVYNRAIEER